MKKKKPPPAPRDAVLAILEARNTRDLGFLEATDEVTRGHDLQSDGNRRVGKDIYISTQAPPEVDRSRLIAGARLRVGARERLRRGELRCQRSGDDVTVAVYGARGEPITRVLACRAPGEDELDEGRFTWFSPTEIIGHPWSDNEPAVVQVVTVERLRKLAR